MTKDASTAGLSRGERDELRASLEEEAVKTGAQVTSLATSFEAIVEAAELVNTDDEHDPEGTTIAFERAQVTALHRQAAADLEAIHGALDRLAAEEYGFCATCGEPIGLERLRALPASTHCVRCA